MASKTYVAFLRGINVGGNAKINMAELKTVFESLGYDDVKTYINSGNIIFKSAKIGNSDIEKIEKSITEKFKLAVGITIFSKNEWQKIINSAPQWWGHDANRKHNLIILLRSATTAEVLESVGLLKQDIESLEAGNRVLYQSLSLELFGRTTGGKLASQPVYKKITIRNFNTAIKINNLMQNH
jgi:uncharacterized protein (DUF1697 family)